MAKTYRKRSHYPIALFALVTITLIALATAFLLWNMRAQQLAHTRMETVGLTRIFAEQTEQNFASADLVLEGVRERMQTSFGSQLALDGEAVHLLLGTRVMWMRQLDVLYVADEEGWIVNSSAELPPGGMSVSKRDYFKEFRATDLAGLFIDRPTRSPGEKEWVIHLARRINDAFGNFRGVVVAVMTTNHFEDGFNMMRLDYSRPVALYRSDGILIASIPHRENMIGDRPPELGSDSLPLVGNEVRFLHHTKNVNDVEEFTLAPVPKFPLLISVTNDEEEALATWRETSIPIVIGVVLMSGMIIFVAALFIRKARAERKLANALGEVSDRYEQTVDSVMDAIVGVNESQNIVLFNPAAEKMFGWSCQQVLGKPLNMLIPPRFHQMHHSHVSGFRHSKVSSRIMAPLISIMGLRADGTEFPIESTISQTEVEGQFQQTAVLRDVTDRRRTERELLEMNEQLRGLSIAQEKIREHERGRIAGELHDDLGQQLTGLKLDIAWLSNRIRDGRLPEHDKVDALRQHIDVAIASVRRIATELRPLVLSDLGFGDALAWQAGEFFKRSGIPVEVDLAAQDLVTNGDLAVGLYRITQESLTNIMRHANASHIGIRLFEENDTLVLTIQDDGVGLPGHRDSGGFGLLGMRERAKSLDATFQLIDGPDGGTTVRVEIALDAPIFTEDAAE